MSRYIIHNIVLYDSGDVIAFVLAANNVIARWRTLMGPTNSNLARNSDPQRLNILCLDVMISIRALYGFNKQKNAVHGSDSLENAEREIKFFFPTSSCYDNIRDS